MSKTNQVMKQCPFCKGRIESQRIEHIHRWKGGLYILRNVPVEVCNQCSEVFFAPEELLAMDEIVNSEVEPKEHISIPVYTL